MLCIMSIRQFLPMFKKPRLYVHSDLYLSIYKSNLVFLNIHRNYGMHIMRIISVVDKAEIGKVYLTGTWDLRCPTSFQ
jgi:hypothetical protein